MTDDERVEQASPEDDIRIENSPDLILALTKPRVDKEFSGFVSRDLAVSNIPKNAIDRFLILSMRYNSIVMDFTYLNIPFMANIYDADHKVVLNLLRSVDGFERKQQTTVTSRKEISEDRVKKKLGV